jgi:membrane protein
LDYRITNPDISQQGLRRMKPRRAVLGEDLALIAATVLVTLAVRRHLFERATIEQITKAPAVVQLSDAEHRIEAGHRGRSARAPWQIPIAGWRDILVRTYQQIDEDRLLATAAGVVFYGLLATFPAVSALVSSYGLFADPATIAGNLQGLSFMLPDGSFSIIQDQIARIAAKGHAALGFTFMIGLLMAIWSANAGMKAIIDALNVVYEEREKRGFIRLNVVSLTLTVGALASILIMVAAVVAMPLALQRLGLESDTETIVRAARWPLLLVLLLAALAILYRFGPSRTTARWQWLSIGAVSAAVLWLIGSSLLSWYLSNFANYTATYGSLGAAIGLMTWMWMSAIIVLCGAELNSEIEHQTTFDTTEGRQKPLGARGAVMADTVGRAT